MSKGIIPIRRWFAPAFLVLVAGCSTKPIPPNVNELICRNNQGCPSGYECKIPLGQSAGQCCKDDICPATQDASRTDIVSIDLQKSLDGNLDNTASNWDVPSAISDVAAGEVVPTGGSGGSTGTGGLGGNMSSGGSTSPGIPDALGDTGGTNTGMGGVRTGGAGMGGAETGGAGTGGAGMGGAGMGGAGMGGACGTSTDPNNCGTCGKICPTPTAGAGTATCVAGQCAINCTTGMACGTMCINVTSDINNCKTCGTKCAAPTTGTGEAICRPTGCDLACNGTTPNKCGTACVNLTSDRNNCGACGTVCATNAQCVLTSGASSCVCNQGYTGTTCAPEDECTTGNHRCGVSTSGSCSTGTGLGYSCTCANGFTSSGGTFPQCYKTGTVTFGGDKITGVWSYIFLTMEPLGYNSFQKGDFYVTDSNDFHTIWANNLGQRGLQRVVSSAPLLEVPIPTTGYNRFGVPVLSGGTYVSLARDPDLNYYIVFRVTAFPSSGFTIEWVMVYRP